MRSKTRMDIWRANSTGCPVNDLPRARQYLGPQSQAFTCVKQGNFVGPFLYISVASCSQQTKHIITAARLLPIQAVHMEIFIISSVHSGSTI